MKRLRLLLALIIAGTLTVSLIAWLVLPPADEAGGEFYSETAIAIVLVDALLAMGSAVLFLMALRNFKPDLKPAYRLVALSTLAVGLGLLVFPYIEYYGLWENVWWNMSSYLQYFIGAPLMYFGVRLFYKKAGLGGWAAWPAVLVVGIAALAAIHYPMPHDIASYWPFSRIEFNLFKLVTLIPIAAYGLAAIMALRLRLKTGSEYKMAFTWLSVGLAFYVVANIGITLIEVIGFDAWYYSSRAYTAPNIAGDLCLLFAGYCFAAIGRPKVAMAKGQQVTSMDIILHVAGMASDESKIDPMLEDMRVLTSHLEPGQPIGAEEQKRLRDVYLKIEDFLIHNDRLRTFKKEQLRADVSRAFALEQNGKDTFWPSL
jgi:hypothetical protein